jgi:CheY-like chemotaxis protein
MILVVDDTIEVAQLLVEVCTTTGYYADFALHGEAALYKNAETVPASSCESHHREICEPPDP